MPPVSMTIVWLIAVIVFAVVEGITATALVSIWFAVGALGALLVSFLTDSWIIQTAVFLALSCIVFALVRPLVKKHFTPKLEKTNAERLIGTQAIVVQRIDNVAGTGQARLKGQIWTARSEDGRPIEEGTEVTVCRIEGVKIIVKPVSRNAESEQ